MSKQVEKHNLDDFIKVLKAYNSEPQLTDDIILTLKNAYNELEKYKHGKYTNELDKNILQLIEQEKELQEIFKKAPTSSVTELKKEIRDLQINTVTAFLHQHVNHPDMKALLLALTHKLKTVNSLFRGKIDEEEVVANASSPKEVSVVTAPNTQQVAEPTQAVLPKAVVDLTTKSKALSTQAHSKRALLLDTLKESVSKLKNIIDNKYNSYTFKENDTFQEINNYINLLKYNKLENDTNYEEFKEKLIDLHEKIKTTIYKDNSTVESRKNRSDIINIITEIITNFKKFINHKEVNAIKKKKLTDIKFQKYLKYDSQQAENLRKDIFYKKYLLYGESEAPHPKLDKDAKHLYLKYKKKYLNLKQLLNM